MEQIYDTDMTYHGVSHESWAVSLKSGDGSQVSHMLGRVEHCFSLAGSEPLPEGSPTMLYNMNCRSRQVRAEEFSWRLDAVESQWVCVEESRGLVAVQDGDLELLMSVDAAEQTH